MTSDLEKLTEEKKGDPDFNPEPYLNEIFHKKLEMERLQTEKEQEKIKFEFLNAGKGSGIYEGETQTLTESANLDKLKDTRYNVQESIRKNLEFVEVHPDDHRRADLLPDRESREQGLTSAEKLSDLRDSIRENKKNQQ
ncbi:MAG: hypothetical protein LWY06_08690 [Firmicutes bacterium]|nr:hypothetical protein [Bacillota bacterium]